MLTAQRRPILRRAHRPPCAGCELCNADLQPRRARKTRRQPVHAWPAANLRGARRTASRCCRLPTANLLRFAEPAGESQVAPAARRSCRFEAEGPTASACRSGDRPAGAVTARLRRFTARASRAPPARSRNRSDPFSSRRRPEPGAVILPVGRRRSPSAAGQGRGEPSRQAATLIRAGGPLGASAAL